LSFLTPLYILGALAIAAPVVFHLIRRAPKGEVPFSSLMFLAPTPPRLTRRSRLDHWLLLLLRAAALALLALAFARPFLRQEARLDEGEAGRRRVALLVDASASMRRGDLLDRARAEAAKVIGDARPGDDLAILAFDRETRTLLGFAESETLDPSRRAAVARSRLDAIRPTWGATDLGQALLDAVGAVEDVADSDEKAGRMPRRIVLISDLASGSNLDALGRLEWPSDVELELRTVAGQSGNAGLQWLADAAGAAPDGADAALRVRVASEADSRADRFTLRWADSDASPIEAYVPPGGSRVVRVPRPEGDAPTALVLGGDPVGFDNTLYLAEQPRQSLTVAFLGESAADDPDGLLYYLDRAPLDTATRTVEVRASKPSAPLELETPRKTPLVVLGSGTTPENRERLKSYMRDGGTVLLVLNQAFAAETLAALADAPGVEAEEAEVGRDVMLGAIDFAHPLFAPFAAPQFNDFTKIHFWKYRKLDPEALGDAGVLARFENGDPALIERPVGRGRLMVLASGWEPGDSQLARSSKFVPLIAGLVEPPGLAGVAAQGVVVGTPIPLPEGPGPRSVRKPDGSSVELADGATTFGDTDQPGLYTIESPAGERTFAVNLDPTESRTSPLEVETLERLGCRLAGDGSAEPDAHELRQLRNAELEGRQKAWRWLILAALGVLIVETWLAGWQSRPRAARGEAVAT
jgi:hypothetical protein